MLDLNYLAIGVSAVAALVLSTVYYMVFAKQMAPLSPAYADPASPPAWKILLELVRSLIAASVLAGLASKLGITEWTDAVLLGLAMWVGFPVVLLLGSVMWEKVPGKLAAIHAGRLAAQAPCRLHHRQPLALSSSPPLSWLGGSLPEGDPRYGKKGAGFPVSAYAFRWPTTWPHTKLTPAHSISG